MSLGNGCEENNVRGSTYRRLHNRCSVIVVAIVGAIVVTLVVAVVVCQGCGGLFGWGEGKNRAAPGRFYIFG